MADYKKKCGPDAFDEYDSFVETSSFSFNGKTRTGKERNHIVSGTGIMTCNNAYTKSFDSRYHYIDNYSIKDGITELGNGCLSRRPIRSIELPPTLKKIGDNCFRYSQIKDLQLPEELEEIGRNNFPESLETITLPPLIKDFPFEDLNICTNLVSIEVTETNKYYKSIDGILYSYDLLKVIYCPRGKNGNVKLPKSVKTIESHCFENCVKLSGITIRPYVKEIGDYAFSGIKMDSLIIPNSVENLGVGCLSNSVITTELKLPALLKDIPNMFLYKAVFPSPISFRCAEIIGDNAFDETGVETSLQDKVVLPNVRYIGKCGFRQASKIYYLSSKLERIEEGAFAETDDNLVIRLFSLAPIKINDNAFDDIASGATLIVPPNTKFIFENAYPWYLFENIEELATNLDSDESDTTVSDEEWANRLQSIIYSVKNADRAYLREIIDTIKENYYFLDDEDSYEEALSLLKYNYSFSPAIENGLETEICKNWPVKYKLKLYEKNIYAHHLALTDTHQIEVSKNEHGLLESAPSLISQEEASGNCEVHFSEISEYLIKELSKVRYSLKIAVSWFTNYELLKKVKKLASDGIKVQLITNNDLINNGGYCLDFNELIGKGVEISLVEYPHLLHDKFCIIDDNFIINGSYNWTRFSGKNYENIVIHRDDRPLTRAFMEEFDYLLAHAEHKVIQSMPGTVPERPEYDRSAFKQYVTEELDDASKEISDERQKITVLQRAKQLNEPYFNLLNKSDVDVIEKADIRLNNEVISTELLEKHAKENAVKERQKEIEQLKRQQKALNQQSESGNGNQQAASNH